MRIVLKLPTLLLTIVLGVLFSTSSFGQGETSPAGRSSLSGVDLPSGAQRVNDANVPAEIDQTLEKLIAQSEGKLRRGDREVLLWTGSELKTNGGKNIVKRLTETLKTDGWQYEVGGTENGITLFTVLKDGTERRAIIGLHGEVDGTLIFAWTELLAAGGRQAVSTVSPGIDGGDVSDYSFTTPAGWTRSDAGGKIVLSKDGDKSLTFLPLTASSGDLERDADRLLWQFYKGHDSWYANGFRPDYGTFEKGRTSQGLEYFRAYRYAKKISDSNDGLAPSKFDAIILVVKLGSNVAVVVGRQPFQSDYARDSTLNAIDLILYDLSFKSVNNTYNLKNELLGSWTAATSTVGLAYTFNANGTFNKGGASQFRTSRDAYTDNVTTTSYGMTETYSLTGNILTQNYKRTGQTSKYKIRIYQTKYDKDPWQHKLGFLSVADPTEPFALRRSE